MPSLVTNIQGYSIHDGPGIRTVVFLKGCGLACRWCANPECIATRPEIGQVKTLCARCGKCAEACPQKAIMYGDDGTPKIDRALCNGCGECSTACAYKALVLYGRPMTAAEIYGAVSRDKMFYDASGGGLTVSGGEPLLHPQLVAELFEKCRRAGIHTCMETSGYVPEKNIMEVLPFCDLAIYDLKLMDAKKHAQYTGKPNDRILANAKKIAASGVNLLFRLPLVPGINDDDANIAATADFLHGLGGKALNIELMPYHKLGKGKYESLDKKYSMPDIAVPGPEYLEVKKKAFEDKGIACTVSR